MKFSQVVFFGYSKLFEKLSRFNHEKGISTFLVSSERLKEACSLLDLVATNVIFTSKLDDLFYKRHQINGKNALGISIGSPFIFTDDDINFFLGNLVNSHGAPLPDYRGGGGFSWRILNNDRRGACLIHKVSRGIDTGKVIFKHSFLFDNGEKIPVDYMARQAIEETNRTIPFLKQLIQGDELPDVSDNSKLTSYSTYFPRLSTDIHGVIDWDCNIHDVVATIHAFSHPYSGAQTCLQGHRLRIFDCEIIDNRFWHSFCRGIVLNSDKTRILIACNGGTLKVLRHNIKFDGQFKLY